MTAWLSAYLRSTTEYSDWQSEDRPALTWSATLFIISLIEVSGFWDQGNVVGAAASGKALSFPLFAYLACYFAGCGIYYARLPSITLTFSDTLASILTARVAIELALYKPVAPAEMLALSGAIMVPLMLLTPTQKLRDFWFLLFSAVGWIFLVLQLHELYATGDRGVVDIRFLGASTAMTLAFFCYATSHGAELRPVAGVSAVTMALLLAIIGLWVHFG